MKTCRRTASTYQNNKPKQRTYFQRDFRDCFYQQGFERYSVMILPHFPSTSLLGLSRRQMGLRRWQRGLINLIMWGNLIAAAGPDVASLLEQINIVLASDQCLPLPLSHLSLSPSPPPYPSVKIIRNNLLSSGRVINTKPY